MILRALFLLLFAISHLSAYASPNQFNLNVSDLEKKYLERFFDAFFLGDDFSYTLFCEKPMSFNGFYKDNPEILEIMQSFFKKNDNLSLWNAIEVIKKYRKHINERYIFLFNEAEKNTFIYFIHKPSFIKTINANIDIFINELGEGFTTDAFLEEIMNEERDFLDIIHHHEGILGILLGYGRHNAMLFQKKADILGRCWAYGNYIKKQSREIKNPPNILSAMQELHDLNDRLDSFSTDNEYSPFTPVAPLGFAADMNHLETQKLKQKYSALKKVINVAYTKSNPTDVIVNMLFGMH